MAKSPLSQYKFLLIFLSWWAIWAFLQTSLLIGFGLSAKTSLVDSILSNALVALSCGFLSNNMQYYLPKKERYWYILFISLTLSAIILLACKAILVPALSDKPWWPNECHSMMTWRDAGSIRPVRRSMV